ncbi:hypothetical protein FMM05_03275 [Flavobacterium zepuense]|uniref:TonB family protein n=1 Tax=Flavobacterium zepuense TaxID=2593302 RepID=A0A552V7I2_9FLAO|nr:hypothetical protein [Flavobacterium zepuense]TRW26415.1 hypothetical protein FMM05_03275 [Flavobacterium zepuense]
MRLTILLICLLVQGSLFAQKGLSSAVLPDCATEEKPFTCTDKKLEAGVISLINTIVINTLPEESKAYFSVSAVIVTDENGLVIKDYTKIKSPSPFLDTRIQNYLNNLPAFIPKDKSYEERRSVDFINLTFILDSDTKKYYIAEKEDLKALNIKSEYIMADEASLYPGCERTGNYTTDFNCTQKKVYEFILKHYRVPQVQGPGQLKMMVTFSIDTKGVIKVESIEGGESGFQSEARRVINKLPNLTPTKVKDIPIKVSFNLPITINVT